MFIAPLVIFAMIYLFGPDSGIHCDCKDIKSIPSDNTKQQTEWFDYCSYTPQDFTKNIWGETRDWKTGNYIRQ